MIFLISKRLLNSRRSVVSRFIKHIGSACPSRLLLREFPDMVLCMPTLVAEGHVSPGLWWLESTHTLHIAGLQSRAEADECYFLLQNFCIIRIFFLGTSKARTGLTHPRGNVTASVSAGPHWAADNVKALDLELQTTNSHIS